jgi:hypothetical protein
MDRRIRVLSTQLQELAVILEEEQVELYNTIDNARRLRAFSRRERERPRALRDRAGAPGERSTTLGRSAGE